MVALIPTTWLSAHTSLQVPAYMNLKLQSLLLQMHDQRCCSVYVQKIDMRSAANLLPARMNRQAVAAHINRQLAFRLKASISCLVGHPLGKSNSSLRSPRLCSRNIVISWSTIDGDILWSTKSWCSASGIW
jgi:hypothetical protein